MVSKRDNLRRIARYSRSFAAKTRVLIPRLRPLVERLIPWWVFGWLALSLWKVASAPAAGPSLADRAFPMALYVLIALAPIAALRIAERAFPSNGKGWQPRTRFAFVGRWRELGLEQASKHRLYGPVGMLASLVVGMLFNIVMRSGEFMLSVPAVTMNAPDWARALFVSMAIETIALNFLYMVCFVMALRAVPAFPRMLFGTWLVDIAFQFRTAAVVGSQPALPPEVAAGLAGVLQNNIIGVCISIFIWLPYLLLSKRANLTFRHRLAA